MTNRCFCSKEEVFRHVWALHEPLQRRMPATSNPESNRVDVDGTLFGTMGQYVSLEDNGEQDRYTTNRGSRVIHSYTLWVISQDKLVRDEVVRYVLRNLSCGFSFNSADGKVCRFKVSGGQKGYASEDCVYFARLGFLIFYWATKCCAIK